MAVAQKAEVVADGEIAEAALGHRRRAFAGRAIESGHLACLLRRRDNLVELGLDLFRDGIENRAVAHGDRQIGGTDEQHVDAFDRGDRIQALERLARLDHGDGDGHVVCVAQVGFHVGETAEHHGAVGSPAAVADRGKLGDGNELPGIFDGADQRRHHALGAHVERAAHHRPIVIRGAHDGRRADAGDRANTGDRRGEIPHAVLHVDRDGGKARARQHLGDDGGGERRPAGIDGFAGAQAPGQGKGHVSRSP